MKNNLFFIILFLGAMSLILGCAFANIYFIGLAEAIIIPLCIYSFRRNIHNLRKGI
jgi:hypothetical protein